MSTSTARGFRAHHAVIHSPGSPRVVRQLLEEWTVLNAAAGSGAKLQQWAHLEPALEGHTSLAGLVDAVDAGGRDHADKVLAALARLAQKGHPLAGRIALQVMLPALSSLPRRCRLDDDAPDDRWQVTLAAFYSVLHRLRATENVAGRLTLDTLHAVTAETRSSDASAYGHSVPIDDLSDRPGVLTLDGSGDVDHASDLSDLLVWAVREEVLNVREAQLLADSYLPGRRPAHGDHQLGAADCKCRTRARRKLIDAVRDHVAIKPAARVDVA